MRVSHDDEWGKEGWPVYTHPKISSKVGHELGLNIKVGSFGWKRVRVLQKIFSKGRTLTIGEIPNFGSYLVNPFAVQQFTTHVGDLGRRCTKVLTHPLVVLHPARDWISGMRGLDSFGNQPPRHLDDSNCLVGFQLSFEGFQRKEASLGTVSQGRTC
jgi:hypothetical protein